MNEPRTIEEQYTSAGNADDLTVTSERRTDADVLVASGWTPGLLGGVLFISLRARVRARKLPEPTDI